MTSAPHLFTETSIGKLALKNRLAVAPMTRVSASAEGSATDDRCSATRACRSLQMVSSKHRPKPPRCWRLAQSTSLRSAKVRLLTPTGRKGPAKQAADGIRLRFVAAASQYQTSEIRSAPCADRDRTRQRNPARPPCCGLVKYIAFCSVTRSVSTLARPYDGPSAAVYSKAMPTPPKYPSTPDARYFVVAGRLWRMSNPELAPEERQKLVDQLMDARRQVGAALKNGDADAERSARAAVDETKRALGERGPVWWTDGAPDFNRRLVANTPYAQWYAALLSNGLR